MRFFWDFSPVFLFAEKSSSSQEAIKLDNETFDKFSHNIREIKQRHEKGGITSKEVEAILGKPNYKNDKSIRLDGAKEVWHYWHLTYASVRYLFVFNKDGHLMMLTSVQNLNPKIGDVYYDVEYFLSNKKEHKKNED